MHQDFFRALTYDHHFRQKSAIYCYRLNSITKLEFNKHENGNMIKNT